MSMSVCGLEKVEGWDKWCVHVETSEKGVAGGGHGQHGEHLELHFERRLSRL